MRNKSHRFRFRRIAQLCGIMLIECTILSFERDYPNTPDWGWTRYLLTSQCSANAHSRVESIRHRINTASHTDAIDESGFGAHANRRCNKLCSIFRSDRLATYMRDVCRLQRTTHKDKTRTHSRHACSERINGRGSGGGRSGDLQNHSQPSFSAVPFVRPPSLSIDGYPSRPDSVCLCPTANIIICVVVVIRICMQIAHFQRNQHGKRTDWFVQNGKLIRRAINYIHSCILFVCARMSS